MESICWHFAIFKSENSERQSASHRIWIWKWNIFLPHKYSWILSMLTLLRVQNALINCELHMNYVHSLARLNILMLAPTRTTESFKPNERTSKLLVLTINSMWILNVFFSHFISRLNRILMLSLHSYIHTHTHESRITWKRIEQKNRKYF